MLEDDMEDKKFRGAYKDLFDGIRAGDELKARVLAGKRKKHNAGPAIAAIGTIAAAVAIFAAVRGYDFSHRDDGVITETAVTETAVPQKNFHAPAEQSPEKPDAQAAVDTEQPASAAEAAVDTEQPASAAQAAKKTTEDYMREALEGMNTAAPAEAQSVHGRTQSTQQYTESAPEVTAAPKVTAAPEQKTVPQETNGNINATEEEQDVPAAKPRMKEQSSVTADAEAEDTEKSIVIPFPTGSVTLRMNSSSVLEELMYEAVPASEEADISEVYHTEKWDNQRYFDYLGIDIINSLKIGDDMKYAGDDMYYFTVDANGRLKNDTRIFTFKGSEGRLVSVITSRDTTFVDSVLGSPEVVKSKISDIQVAAFQPDQAYYFYMKSNNVAYIITTEELDGKEIADLLSSLDTEQ